MQAHGVHPARRLAGQYLFRNTISVMVSGGNKSMLIPATVDS